jgi:hypothetical protein
VILGQFWTKKLAFLTHNPAKFCRHCIITFVFKKDAKLFRRKLKKSLKIVIIDPGFSDCVLKTWQIFAWFLSVLKIDLGTLCHGTADPGFESRHSIKLSFLYCTTYYCDFDLEYFLKYARAGERTRDLLILFIFYVLPSLYRWRRWATAAPQNTWSIIYAQEYS